MASSRKDSRGRVLRKEGWIVQYRYTDLLKIRRTIYDSDLNELRKKEMEIEKQLGLGIRRFMYGYEKNEYK